MTSTLRTYQRIAPFYDLLDSAFERKRYSKLRPLLFEDGALADMLLHTFMRRREILQQHEGVGLEVIGPRSSAPTRRLIDYAHRRTLQRLVLGAIEAAADDGGDLNSDY